LGIELWIELKRREKRRENANVRGGGANVLVEFASAGEHNNRNLGVAENGELVGLLEKAIASFGVGDLAVGGVLYPLDLDLSTSHGCCFCCCFFLMLMLMLLFLSICFCEF